MRRQPRSPRGELAELVDEFGMPKTIDDLIDIAKFFKGQKKNTFWAWVIVHLQDAKTAAEKAEIET